MKGTKMNLISIQTNLIIDELADCINDPDAAKELIIKLDKQFENWDFTLELANYFVAEIREYFELNKEESFDDFIKNAVKQ